MPAAALQSILEGRFAEVMRFREKPARDALPSGIPALDFPCGAVTEIYGPPSSGRTTLLLSALAQATAREEFCALVDVDDAFDPASAAAAGVALERLLWVRCGGTAEHALKVTDLLVHGGGFGLVAMGLGDTPPETGRRIPPASRAGSDPSKSWQRPWDAAWPRSDLPAASPSPRIQTPPCTQPAACPASPSSRADRKRRGWPDCRSSCSIPRRKSSRRSTAGA